MPKAEKVKIVQEIKEKIKNSDMVIFTDYRGLTVNELSALRKDLNKNSTVYKVFKNTMINLALAECDGLKDYQSLLEGPTALAFTEKEFIEAAKILKNFSVKNKNMEIKGGILQSEVISLDKINFLTTLPGKEVLLAKVVSSMKSPLINFILILSAIQKNFLGVLQSIKKQKEESSNK